ncbi:MAG: tRNA lysidine(34) synthetase TilS [Thiotrichaceae bacterium]
MHSEKSAYLIAYSGGLDSHVLLHLFATIAKEHPEITLRSIYIDHGLQEASVAWLDHCQQIADTLHIECLSTSLHLKIPKGESLEAVARKVRYQAIGKQLRENEVLLTAHHQDDQAETLLLQLLRGAGLDGLAAMPLKSNFAKSEHLRPLLNYSREQLEEYAKKHELNFITDPSNKEDRFDRNFLRNSVIPMMKQRWPQMGQTLSRSATLQAEASQLQASYLNDEIFELSGSREATLSSSAITALPLIKQKAVLRHWIKQSGFKMPSAKKLQHVMGDVLNSKLDAMPLVEWKGAEIRRYGDDVYIMSPQLDLSPSRALDWDISGSLDLGENLPTLNPNDLGDLKTILLEQGVPVTVRFRQGGERIRLRNRQCTIALKKLLQEERIPPWQRDRVPLVFAGDQLISVWGLAQIDKKNL